MCNRARNIASIAKTHDTSAELVWPNLILCMHATYHALGSMHIGDLSRSGVEPNNP